MRRLVEDIRGALNSLTKEQQKIIYISALVLVFLVLFFIFVYRPQSRNFNQIKKRLTETDAQIAEIMKIAAGRELAEATQELKARFTQISARVPGQDEQLLGMLSEQARKFKIEVKVISPTAKKEIGDKIRGYQVEEVDITMELACDFSALGEFLDFLQDEYPVLIQVKELRIERKNETQSRLDVTLQLRGYLAREKK